MELCRLSKKEIEDLVKILNTHSWVSKREQAAWELGSFGEKAIPYLVNALKDSADRVKCSVIDALGKIGSIKALKHLEKITFSNDYNTDVRIQSYYAIANTKTQEAMDLLVNIIENSDNTNNIRKEAAFALSKMRSKAKGARHSLIKIIENEQDNNFKEALIFALGEICTKDNRAIKLLIASMTVEKDWRVRVAAVKALGRLYALGASRDIINTLLNDKSVFVRNTAMKTAKKLSLHNQTKYPNISENLIKSILIAKNIEENSLVKNQIDKIVKKFQEKMGKNTILEIEKEVKQYISKVGKTDLKSLEKELFQKFESITHTENKIQDTEIVMKEIDDEPDYEYSLEENGTTKKILINRKPIKLLLLGAEPQDQNSLDHKQELNQIRSLKTDSNLKVIPQYGISTSEFLDALDYFSPDILHISAHGGEGEIVLEDLLGNSEEISLENVAEIIITHNKSQLKEGKNIISCVVFSSCYSFFNTTELAKNIECLIVMTDSITTEAANKFAVGFYNQIRNGKDIQTAFDMGLSLIVQKDIPKLLPKNKDFNHIYFIDKDYS